MVGGLALLNAVKGWIAAPLCQCRPAGLLPLPAPADYSLSTHQRRRRAPALLLLFLFGKVMAFVLLLIFNALQYLPLTPLFFTFIFFAFRLDNQSNVLIFEPSTEQ